MPVKMSLFASVAIYGQFTAVLAKHSKSFSLVDAITVGWTGCNEFFDPTRQQVETSRQTERTTANKMIIYQRSLRVPRRIQLSGVPRA
jgi:hypothetical protein